MIKIPEKSRKKIIIDFLKQNDLKNCKLIKIRQDASSRKYYRIKDKNLLLMDSISKENKNNEFIKLSKYLNSIELSAPKIIAKSYNKGLFLIEDLGDLTFTNAIKSNIEEKILYLNAVNTLVKLHTYNNYPNIPKYTFNQLLKELNIFIEWYFKENNLKLSKKSIIKWNNLWKSALNNITDNNDCIVLRDFHADNLFWLPNRKNLKKIGLIDFQDSLVGHITYDISSLLEDVRRKISSRTKESALKKFIKLKKIKDKNLFYTNYYTITAQRNAKIVGIFIRLARRDKKTKYLKLVDRAMNIFIESLQKANQTEILDWVYININKEEIKHKICVK